jgi:hypothetical protein
MNADGTQEVEAMPYAKYSPQEVEARGEEIYQQQIRQAVEPGNKGKFVVIDIETGQYEVDESDLQATKRALAKRADAVLYGLRIGYPAAYTLGGHVTMDQG